MTVAQLSSALQAVNWNANVQVFLTDTESVEKLDRACARLALWSSQLELLEGANPAIAFVRALQISGQHIVASCALGLYRAAAASIRSIVENGLYYTYFRNHPAELATLVRDFSYYVLKSDVMSYHKLHTPDFQVNQTKLNFVGDLEKWYGEISAVVHGQIPGKWISNVALNEITYSADTMKVAADSFVTAEDIVHRLFLLTVGSELWDAFSPQAKSKLLTGMTGQVRASLGLDKR